MSVLSLKDVSYHYAKSSKNVLDNINIDFEAGKIYVIVGKSGAGKTTLLSLIAGLDVSTSGTILYHGSNLNRLNLDQYRAQKIGVIFQSYNLITNAKAIENIILSMNISGNKDKNMSKVAYAILKKVGIDSETANRKIPKLSGGEQQRVGIARAISHDPDIIIADEPTSNLDDQTEDSIMGILSNLATKENKCVVIVTHSNKIASYADEVWGITNGRLLFIQ